jgi:predicted nucleotidyltransferase component of viral defense system
MLTKEQLHKLSKELKTNEYVVAREYLQLLILKELYSKNFSDKIFFKGGTCIRIIYGGSRFSEDLDFTVMMEEKEFNVALEKFFKQAGGKYPVEFKQRETLIGKTFLATIKTDFLKQSVYIKLDFSFREDVLEPAKEIVSDNSYPIVFKGFVHCLSKDEIFAEKIRAFLSREKYRDVYDLWILLELGAKFKKDLIGEKLTYYNIDYSPGDFREKIDSLSKKEFVEEIRPFVPIGERNGLGELFDYISEYLRKRVSQAY